MTRAILLVLATLSAAVATPAFAADPIPVGSRRELFVDRYLVETLTGGARVELHHPVPKEIVIVHDAPWEGSGCGYQGESGDPLPGFSLANCAPIYGDAVNRIVSWDKGADLSALAGKAIRIRFVLHDADLYAFQFRK